MSFSLEIRPHTCNEQKIVIHFNNVLYSCELALPSGPSFNLYTVLNNFLPPELYNSLPNSNSANPPPNNYINPNISSALSTDSHGNDSSSSTTTVLNFPINPSLSSNSVATASPFSNIFSYLNASSPPLFTPNMPS
ncbi:hypothetical protein O181_116740 [Austropuccinia psidii MF-1]|uniref:Uncharacterized protein n=1 Tax=Austropuccinia psidii MF-1 TaxID=1389203 RepID=A0A9Q3PXQ9_9BASI|nr:hypothetical protein [Austropuccinia psidii MF-1]